MLNTLVYKLWRTCVHTFQSHNIGIHALLMIVWQYSFFYHLGFIVFLILSIYFFNSIHKGIIGGLMIITGAIFYLNQTIPESIQKEVIIINQEVYTYQSAYHIRYDNKRFIFYASIDSYEIGDKVYIKGHIDRFTSKTRPFGIDFNTYYKSQGIYGQIDIERIEWISHHFHINQLRYDAMQTFSRFKSKPILSAFIFNEELEESSQIQWHYLLRVSGIHMFVLIEILKFFFRKHSLHPMITIGITILFWFLQDYHVSMMRLVLYYSMNLLLFTHKFQIISSIKWLMIWCIQLLLWPHLIFHVGLLITYSIVFGISLTYPYLKHRSNVLRLVIYSTLVQIILGFVTYQWSLIQIVLSPFIYMISIFILYPLTLLTLAIPVFDSILIKMYVLINQFFQSLDEKSFSIALKSLEQWMIFLAAMLLIYALSSNHPIQVLKRMWIFILFMVIVTFPFDTSNVSLYFLDVGQGDAAIIKHNECVIVIDAFKYIEETLRGLGETEIDYVFITHNDMDHNKELNMIMNRFHVQSLITNPYSRYDYQAMKSISIPHDIRCGKIHIQVLSPTKDYLNDNDNSLVLLVSIYNTTWLLTGDISKEVERDLIDTYPTIIKNVTGLKIGHHGSKTSSDKAFIHHVNAQYTMISVGRNNAYGMPHQEVLDTFVQQPTRLLRTDTFGTIMFNIKPDSLHYVYMRP